MEENVKTDSIPVDDQDENYFSATVTLLQTVKKGLDVKFKTHWYSVNGTKWEDRSSNIYFINGPGRDVFMKAEEQEKVILQTKSVEHWTFTLIIDCLQCMKFHDPKNSLENFRSVVNELTDLEEAEINRAKFQNYQKQLLDVMGDLNIAEATEQESKTECTKSTSAPVEEIKPKPDFKSLGNDAFKKNGFEDSIQFYTDGIHVRDRKCSELPELGALYANRSAAYLQIRNLIAAKKDAKGAICLCPSWWKAYYRLGKVYQMMGKPEKAAKAFTNAQKLAEESENQNIINLCNQLINQMENEEVLD